MTPLQKRKRALLEQCFGRPDPQATRRSVEERLRRLVPKGTSLELHTDEHRGYPRAIARLEGRTIHHRTIHHRTIAFSKRRQGALYRLAIHQAWRNWIKDRSENRRDGPPGKALGLIAKALTPKAMLATRLFPWRVGLTGWLERCYRGRIETPSIGTNRTHTAKYAV